MRWLIDLSDLPFHVQMAAWRKDLGWSQQDLAAATSKCRTTIWRLENGNDARVSTIQEVLTALGFGELWIGAKKAQCLHIAPISPSTSSVQDESIQKDGEP